MQQGSYNIQVIVKDSYSCRNRRVRDRVLYGEVAGRRNQRGDQPHVQPPGRPVQRAPSPGSSMYVQFAQLGPNPSWQDTAPLPIVPGESTNFLVAGMLPEHDVPHEGRPERWDDLRPSGVHDREPADELDFPHLH